MLKELSPKRWEKGIHAKVWSQNVPERRNSKCKVPKADLKLICSRNSEISVCRGWRGPQGGGRGDQEAGAESQLYAAWSREDSSGEAACLHAWVWCQSSSWWLGGEPGSHGGWWLDPKLDGGKRGGRDGNIFDIEQAPGLLMDLDVGD